ncbi:MAG: hypothetical protein ACAH59_08560 [Pseudobdellovibrionaceae bacterium]
MSTTCPQCGFSLGDLDFGVVTCPQCAAVLFVDMDGNINVSAEAASASNDHERTQNDILAAASGEFQEMWTQDQEPVADVETSESPIDPVQEQVLMETAPMEEAVYEEPIPAKDPNDLSEISDYGNSDQAFGPLSYSVMIENIDTKEIRQQLLEALNDSKFGWDAKELMKRTKLGKLQLENLNPVKASVLVHRLQDVPVKVSWVQHAFS